MAFCSACGAEENGAFCRVCGARLPMPPLSPTANEDGAAALSELPGDEIFSVIFPAVPSKQSRWSVLFRPLAVIPLFAVSLWFAAGLLVVAPWAWLVAVFTGRVPNGARRYLTKYLRLQANINAYALFVTGTWPGIQWNARAQAEVRVSSGPVVHRRLAVLFRLLLNVPAAIVVGALSAVGAVVAVLQWLCGIVLGRQPLLLHQWRVVTLRYLARAAAYSLLLTPMQPFRGLVGDPHALSDRPGAVATSGALRALVIGALVIGVPLNLIFTNHFSGLIRAQVSRVVLASARDVVDGEVANVEQLPTTCAPQAVNVCGATNTTVASLLTAVTQAQNTFANVYSLNSSKIFEAFNAEAALEKVASDAQAITPIGVHSESDTLSQLRSLRLAEASFDQAVRQWIASL